MAGFPETGTRTEIGLYTNQLAGPVSLSSFVNQQPGPGPQQIQRRMQYLPGKPGRPG
jgi:hypothetical protein